MRIPKIETEQMGWTFEDIQSRNHQIARLQANLAESDKQLKKYKRLWETLKKYNKLYPEHYHRLYERMEKMEHE